MNLGIKSITLRFDDNQLGYLQPVQGDTKSRGFLVEMVSTDGEVLDASSNYECRLYGVNSNYPDKTFYTVATVEEGRYKLYLSTDMVSKAGTLKLQVALYKGSQELIQSEVKEVEVTESMANGGSIGKDLVVDFTKLEKALERVDTQEKAYQDSLQKQEVIKADIDKKQKQVSTDTTAVEKIRTDMEGVMAAEASRVSAEKTRQSQESTRQSQESTRKSQESIRQSNETTRKNQESARVEAEKKRVSAENSRTSAESTRDSQESTRQQNENVRIDYESQRRKAEERRHLQEEEMHRQETARAKAEEKRKATFEGWNLTMQGVIPNGTQDKAGIVKAQGLSDEEVPYTVYSMGVIGSISEALMEEVDKKADKVHSHSISDVDNLQTELNGKAEKEHKHKCNEIELEDGNTAIDYYYEQSLNSVVELMADDIYHNKTNLDKKISFTGQIPFKNAQIIEKGGSTAGIPNETMIYELE